MDKFDAIIIGFGKGGKTLASELARNGKRVAVIERSDKMYGGTCINVGCIPSKSLVNSSIFSSFQGGSFEEKKLIYKNAVEEKTKLINMLRKKNFDKLNDNLNITVINGIASFVNSNQVKIHTNDNNIQEIEAEYIFINTGSRPFIPSIKGLIESRYSYLSENLLDLEILPKNLVIIGGGYIGMEFASIYRNFGSDVTVIQDSDKFLPREDEEIAQEVFKSLQDRGVKIMLSTNIEYVEDKESYANITINNNEETKTINADAILIATGRRPNINDLNLEAAGVEITSKGAIKVNESLKTTAHNIWAMGDVVGGLQFTYISLDDFRIVKSQLLGDKNRTTQNRGAVPYSVFLEPPFSRVGMTEKEAIEKGYNIKIARLKAAAIPKSQVLRRQEGILKVIINAENDMILGAHLFCEESYEMINLIKLAIDSNIPYTILRDNIYTHPTMSEALNDLFSNIS